MKHDHRQCRAGLFLVSTLAFELGNHNEFHVVFASRNVEPYINTRYDSALADEVNAMIEELRIDLDKAWAAEESDGTEAVHEEPNRREAVGVRAGDTPLHYAARLGAAEVAAMLLESGADPSIRDADGTTAVELASMHGIESTVHQLLVDAQMLAGDPPQLLAFAASWLRSRGLSSRPPNTAKAWLSRPLGMVGRPRRSRKGRKAGKAAKARKAAKAAASC